MSFFKGNKDNKKNVLPSAGESSKQTKKRKTIDWKLNVDAVDGPPLRQGTRGDKISCDSQGRPILLAADLFSLIKGTIYHLLLIGTTGTHFTVTFAEYQVQKTSAPTSSLCPSIQNATTVETHSS
jgi:hypothetical protein